MIILLSAASYQDYSLIMIVQDVQVKVAEVLRIETDLLMTVDDILKVRERGIDRLHSK